MEIKDRRFEGGDWPIKFDIPVEDADRWSRYLGWGCHKRGWSPSSLGQMERAENSGTITVSANGKPQLDIVWERRRARPLKLKARLAASSDLSLPEAEQFFTDVNEKCRSGVTESIYLGGTLQYEGLAWRGELWLDDDTRLAPPSLQDETAIIGPRIVHVDVTAPCIGQPDVARVRPQLLTEISLFLSVVMREAVRLPDAGKVWVLTADGLSCEVRHLMYLEPSNPTTMPARGTVQQVPLHRADDPPQGILDQTEISIRDDVASLWQSFRGLSAERRNQFLQAAAKWQEAMIHWQDRPSLSFALMAVSCEALKPPNADERNCYDVIEALLGKQTVEKIRQNPFPAQRVRSTHLHSGEFHGYELVMMDFMRTYDDPSFREASWEMAKITPAAIIEWLKRGGTFALPVTKKRRTMRR